MLLNECNWIQSIMIMPTVALPECVSRGYGGFDRPAVSAQASGTYCWRCGCPLSLPWGHCLLCGLLMAEHFCEDKYQTRCGKQGSSLLNSKQSLGCSFAFHTVVAI
eukprot:GHUV01043008.1.p4 GENE.GHUV01043008.1~~GHUV01043008.1.p4  ORF type:complete len:106 (-),score=10.04 GHUV01043008.1:17-334(-)